MKRALLLLAGVALAVPAIAGSITFSGAQSGSRYLGGGATTMGKHPNGDLAGGTFDMRGALLSQGSVFAFDRTIWTGSFANVDYTGGGLPSGWRESPMSKVDAQRVNLVTGGKNGHLYTNGHVLNRESLRTPVPEPETLGLLGTGLFVIGGLVRRKLKVDDLVTSSNIYRPDGGIHARERNFRTGTLTRWCGGEKGISL